MGGTGWESRRPSQHTDLSARPPPPCSGASPPARPASAPSKSVCSKRCERMSKIDSRASARQRWTMPRAVARCGITSSTVPVLSGMLGQCLLPRDCVAFLCDRVAEFAGRPVLFRQHRGEFQLRQLPGFLALSDLPAGQNSPGNQRAQNHRRQGHRHHQRLAPGWEILPPCNHGRECFQRSLQGDLINRATQAGAHDAARGLPVLAGAPPTATMNRTPVLPGEPTENHPKHSAPRPKNAVTVPNLLRVD